MMAHGQLSEGEAYEALELIEEMVGRAMRGEINQHFADLVITKLAQEKAAQWRGRLGI